MLDKLNVADAAEHDAIRLAQDVESFLRRHGGMFSYHTLPLQGAIDNLEVAYDKLGKLLNTIRRNAA